eukprot:352869-Chlamydomonas_euryale.AAC.13
MQKHFDCTELKRERLVGRANGLQHRCNDVLVLSPAARLEHHCPVCAHNRAHVLRLDEDRIVLHRNRCALSSFPAPCAGKYATRIVKRGGGDGVHRQHGTPSHAT